MNSKQIRELFEHLANHFAEEARTAYLDDAEREAAEAALEEDVSALLAEIGAEVPAHIEALAHVRARALTEEAHAAGYVKQWTGRKRAARRTVERCESLMLCEMRQLAAAGLTELARGKSKTPYILAGPFRVSLAKKAPALLVADGATWPTDWLVPQPDKPDRRLALNDMKALSPLLAAARAAKTSDDHDDRMVAVNAVRREAVRLLLDPDEIEDLDGFSLTEPTTRLGIK